MRKSAVLGSVSFVLSLFMASTASAATYGTLGNFDAVNDSGHTMYGFEIELDDIHSTDVSYTYDWNHFGKPTITEDNSVAGHPKTFVRYASKKNPDGSWASFTNPENPANPILPTNGHMCTDPSVNLGCEHFGVGYNAAPTAVLYHWLADDGAGNLVNGPAVNVAMPVYTYVAPIPNVQPAQVQAVIAPPPPPEPPQKQFGDAVWVKEIKTTTHNNHEIELRNLVGKDPADQPGDENWANGEPDEVEVEWRILQDKVAADGGNDELAGAPEDLPNGDEVITRRYEFYEYTGFLDPESNETLCDTTVSADDLHGVGIVIGTDLNGNDVEFDCGSVVIVGGYNGSQMAAFDVAPGLGFIGSLQDGEENVPYVDRTLVAGGSAPYNVVVTGGALPGGMSIDQLTGVLSGTPTESGTFAFTVSATDAEAAATSTNFSLIIVAAVVPVLDTTTEVSSSSLNPSVYGDAVHFTAQSAVNPPGVEVPTGTMQFFADGVAFGAPVALVAGSATSPDISTLSVGAHTIVANYSGDVYFNGSMSADFTQNVDKRSMSVTADDQTITSGDADPVFTFQYGAFVGTDTAADVDTAPTCGVAGAHNAPGTYPIVCSGGLDGSYSFSYTDGTLTVNEKPAPVITGETSSLPSATSMTIVWTTDNPATSRVVFGTASVSDLAANAAGSPNYGYTDSTVEDATLVTSHSVVVSSLTPGTTYYFRAVSHGSPESISAEIVGQTDPVTGSLKVTKTTLGGDATFGFTGDAGVFSITTVGGTGSFTQSDLLAGTYVVTEDAQAGWTKVSSTCDGAGVAVVAGQTTECSVTNAKQGNIIVNKVTVGGTSTFHFNASYNVNGFDLAGGAQNDSGLIDPTVVAGTYSVSEDSQDGWMLTSATCDNGNDPSAITVDPGQTVSCTFTNTKTPPSNQKGSIKGLTFEDKNKNGAQDAGERGLNGWTIFIDANNNGVKDTGDRWTTTRKDGTYVFKYLPAGTYIVREVLKNHWTQTTPPGGSYTVVLSSGQVVTGKNFGNFHVMPSSDDSDDDHGEDD